MTIYNIFLIIFILEMILLYQEPCILMMLTSLLYDEKNIVQISPPLLVTIYQKK